jgi:hypothetical protein
VTRFWTPDSRVVRMLAAGRVRARSNSRTPARGLAWVKGRLQRATPRCRAVHSHVARRLWMPERVNHFCGHRCGVSESNRGTFGHQRRRPRRWCCAPTPRVASSIFSNTWYAPAGEVRWVKTLSGPLAGLGPFWAGRPQRPKLERRRSTGAFPGLLLCWANWAGSLV